MGYFCQAKAGQTQEQYLYPEFRNNMISNLLCTCVSLQFLECRIRILTMYKLQFLQDQDY